ncbi:MAG: endopeptidase La [Deltaproteobacteria bacterium]|nr:endopeptidase La [Deltaproteobacteria bacterium]
MAGNDENRQIDVPDVLPVLPLRETVVYPMMVAPIVVGQERSVKLVHEAIASNRLAALVTQKSVERRPAQPEDLYSIGTMATIHEIVRAPDKTMRVAVQGLERIRIAGWVRTEPYLVARIERMPELEEAGIEIDALTRATGDLFVKLVGLVAELSDELATAIQVLSDPRQVAYLVASSAPLSTATRQEILELDSVSAKLRRLVEILQHEIAVREVVRKITAETSTELSRAQRQHILRKQMEAIQKELGEVDPEKAEVLDLREHLAKLPLPEEARKEADRELDRLERIPSASPEHGIIRTYLDWLLKLPWGKTTGGSIDALRARTVLDEDHYDLDKIKDRIVEYLAVKKLRGQRRGPAPEGPGSREELREPILCFGGPPGVGKTSLGQSIARSLGRSFTRISLGGIHDEAEVRGHRRTYIGAMPGRILQAIGRVETADPVFMLDEVDKLGVGFHGDPSAALLEVLDPAQNHAFVDTYLGVPFDLSRVLFICTANTTETIPPPLLDRMEVLALSGYTDAEKLYIARRYLFPRQLRAHGLEESEVVVEDAAIGRIIREHTREAGVRNLERELASILRKLARRIGEGAPPPLEVTAKDVVEHLGPQRFFDEVAERIDRAGVATGLAWTPTGGEVLFIEASMMPAERERLILTGMLGDVMRESAQAALSYLRSNAERLGLDPRTFQRKIVHVHVPAGAIPKDGPSAGVAILAALASQVTGQPLRNDVAMTGEITLRGKVLPVGGIKEKVLAAHRAGIKAVVMPRRNEAALEDVPEEVRGQTSFVFVESVDELLDVVLPLGPHPGAAEERHVPVH